MTSPGGHGVDLTALWVPILPETSKLASGVERAGNEAKSRFERATRGFGDTMKKGAAEAAQAVAREQSRALQEVAQAQDKLATASRKAEDAAGRTRTAQQRLTEVMNNQKSTATQLSTATEAYTRAQRAQEEATRRSATAHSEHVNATRNYQQALAGVTPELENVRKSGESMHSGLNSSMSGLALKAGTVAGAVATGMQMALNVVKEGFEKIVDLGEEAVHKVMEIGETWEAVENSFKLHTGASGEALEQMNGVMERIARQGAPVNLQQTADVVGILHQRLQGLDDSQLQTLATHIGELSQRLGQPIDARGFTSALNIMNVPVEDSDKALQSLMNTATKTDIPINELIAGVAKAGPVAREFGLSMGQVGGLMATFTQAGAPASRVIMGIQRSATAFAKEGKTNLGQALKDTIKQIQDFEAQAAAGDTTAMAKASRVANHYFGTRAGANMLAIAPKIDVDQLSEAAEAGGESIDSLMHRTETLETRLLGLKNRVSEAIRPIGLALVEGLGHGFDIAANYVTTHGAEIIGVIKNIGDEAISMSHIFFQVGATVVKALGYIVPALNLVEESIIRGISAMGGVLGRFMEHIPGLQGAGHGLEEVSKAGTAMADALSSAGKNLGVMGNGLQTLADKTGPNSGVRRGFDGFMNQVQASTAFTQALGNAMFNIPEDKKLHIEHNTPEVTEAFNQLGIHITELPDHTVQVTADTQQAADKFQHWFKDTYHKDVEVLVKPKPTQPDGSTWNQTDPKENLSSLFGLDHLPVDGLQVPVTMQPGAQPQIGPFPMPGGGGGGGPAAPDTAPHPGAPPPAPPPGAPAAPGTPAGPGGPGPGPRPQAAAPSGNGGVGDLLGADPASAGVGGGGQGWMNYSATDAALNASAGNPAPATPENWRPVVRWALQTYGPKFGITNYQAWEDALVKQIRTESSGDWTAVNNRDSNAVAGHPSRGVLQFIPSTYATWAAKVGMQDRPFPDPYGEIAAAIPYVAEHWGINQDGSPKQIGNGVGFQQGGPVGFDTGGPAWQPIPGRPGYGTVTHPVVDPSEWASAAPGLKKLAIYSWAQKALAAEGVSDPRALPALVQVVSRESGAPGQLGTGDPNIVNLWDTNAKKGDPSIGFAQVTPGTAADPHNANLPGANLSDPVSNLRAALRHAKATGQNVWELPEARGIQQGYAGGGTARGPVSGFWTPGRDSIPAVLEQGEFVTRRDRAQRMLPFLHWSNNAPVGQLEHFMDQLQSMGVSKFGQGGDVGGVSQVIWSNLEDPSVQAAGGDAGVGVLYGKVASGGPGSPYSDETNPGGQGYAGHHGHVHTTFNRDPFTGEPYNQVPAGTDTQAGEWSKFPAWVKRLGDLYGLDAKTYPGHQEWGGANHGIDWYPRGKQDMSGKSYTHADNATLSNFAAAAMAVGSGQLPSFVGGQGAIPAGLDSPGGGASPGGPVGSNNPYVMSTGANGLPPGYQPSPYQGYVRGPDGKFVKREDVPGLGTYGGATSTEIRSATDAQTGAQETLRRAQDAERKANDKLRKMQTPGIDPDTGEVTPAPTPEQLTEAQDAVRDAHAATIKAQEGLTTATNSLNDTMNKPPPRVEGRVDKDATALGGGLVKGALQELGFDGSVFSDPTQWGIWKTFTGVMNFMGQTAKAQGFTSLIGGPGSGAATQGGGLGSLFPGLFGGAGGVGPSAGRGVASGLGLDVLPGDQGQVPGSPAAVPGATGPGGMPVPFNAIPHIQPGDATPGPVQPKVDDDAAAAAAGAPNVPRPGPVPAGPRPPGTRADGSTPDFPARQQPGAGPRPGPPEPLLGPTPDNGLAPLDTPGGGGAPSGLLPNSWLPHAGHAGWTPPAQQPVNAGPTFHIAMTGIMGQQEVKSTVQGAMLDGTRWTPAATPPAIRT